MVPMAAPTHILVSGRTRRRDRPDNDHEAGFEHSWSLCEPVRYHDWQDCVSRIVSLKMIRVRLRGMLRQGRTKRCKKRSGRTAQMRHRSTQEMRCHQERRARGRTSARIVMARGNKTARIVRTAMRLGWSRGQSAADECPGPIVRQRHCGSWRAPQATTSMIPRAASERIRNQRLRVSDTLPDNAPCHSGLGPWATIKWCRMKDLNSRPSVLLPPSSAGFCSQNEKAP
jgi:hypothetical protein